MNLHTRPIRSFVLRQGRVSQAQRRAIDELWPLHGLEFSSAWLDWHTVFGRHSPRILEIGFGMGETTAQIAASHPETDFLAIDVHTPGIGSLLKQIDAQRLKNLRIMRHDAVEVMRHMIAPASLAGLHVFFPDPWPKKRHHKRRLLQPEFVSLTAARLAPGGYIHVATDWEDYARQILEVFSAEPQLVNTATDFAPRPEHRPLTKFEQRGIKLGHQVWDVVFTRR